MCRALAIAALFLACTGKDPLRGSDPPREIAVAVEPPERLDLLFMIDNSPSPTGSMEFRDDVAELLAELSALPGGGPDLHAGVVSSDLGAGLIPLSNGGCPRIGGDRGVLQTKPQCGLPGGERFVSVAPGGYGSAARSLRCMMDLGVGGCGYEHQLASVIVALDPAVTPENKGFLRPEAHLAVVIVTDEDDCSAPQDTELFHMDLPGQVAGARCALTGHVCGGAHPPAAPFRAPMATCQPAEDGPLFPVKALVDRLRASKMDPDRQLTVAAVFGLPAAHPEIDYRIVPTTQGVDYGSQCGSRPGSAAMGLRVAGFVQAFGPAGSSFDVCQDDLVPTIRAVGRAIVRRLTSVCLPEPVTGCQVMAGQSLPACGDRMESPCWRLEEDTRCPGSAMTLSIEGAGTLPAGTRITARCQPAS